MEVAAVRGAAVPQCGPSVGVSCSSDFGHAHFYAHPSSRAGPACPHSSLKSGFGQGLGCSSRGLSGFGEGLSGGFTTTPSEKSRVSEKSRRLGVVCMANPRRVKMVAQQLKREISDMLLKDSILQEAMMPERALGVDLSVSSVASVTDVMLSNDLQVAKVYVSVYGDKDGIDRALKGLVEKQRYVRSGIAKRMSLRMTPDIRFISDEALERGTEVLAILDSLRIEREMLEKGLKVPNYEIPDGYDDDDLAVRSEEGEPGEEEAEEEELEEDDWETSPEENWDDEDSGAFGFGKDEEDWGASSSRSESSSQEQYIGREMTIAEILALDDVGPKKRMSSIRSSKKTAKKKGKKR